MRKSSAPSFQSKRFVSLKPQLKAEGNSKSTNSCGGDRNATRSTNSILNLMNDKSITLEPAGEPSKCPSYADFAFNSGISKPKTLVEIPNNSLKSFSYGVDKAENTDLPPAGFNYSEKRIYNVVWGKLSKKKHKKWEGDGVAEVGLHSVVLKDCEGKCLGTTRGVKTEKLEEGSRLIVGNKEIELIDLITHKTTGEEIENEEQPSQILQAPLSVSRPQKRPRLMVSPLGNFTHDFHQDALVMPTPSAEHQQTSIAELTEDDIIIDELTV